MKSTLRAFLAAGLATFGSAQVSYDSTTDTWICPIANGSYCVQDSLSSPMIVLCTDGVGMQGNCMGHATSRPPIEVSYAPCWQSSSTSGDAACSKNCTIYPDEGFPFPVPGTCNPSATMTVSPSWAATATSISTILKGNPSFTSSGSWVKSSNVAWSSVSSWVNNNTLAASTSRATSSTPKLVPTSYSPANVTSKASLSSTVPITQTEQTAQTTSRPATSATSKIKVSETAVGGTMSSSTATLSSSSFTGGAVIYGEVARSAAGPACALAVLMFAAAVLL